MPDQIRQSQYQAFGPGRCHLCGADVDPDHPWTPNPGYGERCPWFCSADHALRWTRTIEAGSLRMSECARQLGVSGAKLMRPILDRMAGRR